MSPTLIGIDIIALNWRDFSFSCVDIEFLEHSCIDWIVSMVPIDIFGELTKQPPTEIWLDPGAKDTC